jgi:hypothetical protein
MTFPANHSSDQTRLRYLLLAVAILVEILGLWPLAAQVHVAEYDEAIF